ncbi:hypothetical protein HO607_02960 [Streptococcus suis]|nr:hypothetical protein [Streptococcus suis]
MKLIAKSHEVKGFIDGAVAQIIDTRKHKGYLAKITGTHPTYKLNREFITTYESAGYTYADIEGNGLYEFCTSKLNKDRYYLWVNNDVITEIDYRQALAIAENMEEK